MPLFLKISLYSLSSACFDRNDFFFLKFRKGNFLFKNDNLKLKSRFLIFGIKSAFFRFCGEGWIFHACFEGMAQCYSPAAILIFSKIYIEQIYAIIRNLKPVYLAVFIFHDANFAQKILDLLPLITCQLNNLAIFGVLHYCAVTIVFLKFFLNKTGKNESFLKIFS